MLRAALLHGRLYPGVRRPGLFTLALSLPVLLAALAAQPAHAQTTYYWDGDVEVSLDGTNDAPTGPILTVTEGESVTYYIRLSEEPIYYTDSTKTAEQPCMEGTSLQDKEHHCSWYVMIEVGGQRHTDGFYDLNGDNENDIWVVPGGRHFLQTVEVNSVEHAGDWRQWKSIRIDALDNDVNDGNRTVTLDHDVWGDDGECPVHDTRRITIRIVDDEGLTPPALSVSDATVTEGGTAEFTVRLSKPSDDIVTVDYTTVIGTATSVLGPDSDFVPASGRLTFPSGVTRQTIPVLTVQDDVYEDTETFTVELSSPSSNATLSADHVGVGRIVNDDPLPTLSITDQTVTEGETATFTVTMRGRSEDAATVSYRTRDDTATAGSDYTGISSTTLTFLASRLDRQTRTIAVDTTDDNAFESSEYFRVVLSSPSSATLRKGTGYGTISDNDEADPTLPWLSITDATVEEGAPATFTVALTGHTQPVTVSFATQDDTATSPADYGADSGTLSFPEGTWEQTVTVTTVDDGAAEPSETFRVILSTTSSVIMVKETGFGTITASDGVVDRGRRGGIYNGGNDGISDWDRRVDKANKAILPEMGRAMAFDAVRCRIDQAFSAIGAGASAPGDRPSVSLAGLPAVPGASDDAREGKRDGAAQGGSLSLEQALGASSFVLPLAESAVAASGIATWGCGDIRSLDGDGGEVAGWDGDVSTMQLGIDARFGPNMLVGAALIRSRGRFEYGKAGGAVQPHGSHELELTGVHPYWGMALSPALQVWASLGHAWGELQIRDRPSGKSTTRDATLTSGTVGVTSRVLASDTLALRLKGEWTMARLDTRGGRRALGNSTADVQRLRVATETEYTYLIPYVGLLTPWGELGMHHEGGDGETGASLEVGAGVRYHNIERGWNAELVGRWRAAQGDLPEEQGFAARVRYDPQTLGVGPWVSLTQNWGRSASRAHRVWEEERESPLPQQSLAGSLDAEVGYGIAVLRGRSTLAPFGAVSLADDDGRGYRLGSRLAFGPSARISLEAERRENSADTTADTVADILVVRGDARF